MYNHHEFHNAFHSPHIFSISILRHLLGEVKNSITMCNRPDATVQIALCFFVCVWMEASRFCTRTHTYAHRQAKRTCSQPLHIYPKAEHFFYIFFVHFHVVFEVDDFDFVMMVNVYDLMSFILPLVKFIKSKSNME